MNTKVKKKGPIPIQLIKTLFQCTVLFSVPGLIITFMAPSFTIKLTRVNQERVDATVSQDILFIVPIFKYTATDLLEPESKTISGGSTNEHDRNRNSDVEDQGLILLKGSGGVPIEVYISPVNLNDAMYDIRYFIKESKEPSLRLWVVSNWKFGAILPGGILLFCLVVFLMAAWSIITGKSIESKSAGLKKK